METEVRTTRNNNKTVWIVVAAIVVLALIVFAVLAANGNRDIDEPADLERLRTDLERLPADVAPATRAALALGGDSR